MFQLFYGYAMVSSVVLFLPLFLISAALKAVAGLPSAVSTSIHVDTFLGGNIVKKRKTWHRKRERGKNVIKTQTMANKKLH